MSSDSQGALLEMFIFESDQLLEHLEKIILDSEQTGNYTPESIK